MTIARVRLALLVAALCFALASAAAILWIDAPLERGLATQDWLIPVQSVIDAVTLKHLSAVVGPVLLIGGLIGRRWRDAAGRVAIAFGAIITWSEYVIDVLKHFAGRERPVDWVAAGEASGRWFVGGESFASGHTAYYGAIALAIALRWPRWSLPAGLMAVYVASERVLTRAHHPGDVLASFAVVSLGGALLMPVLRDRQGGQRTSSPSSSPSQ